MRLPGVMRRVIESGGELGAGKRGGEGDVGGGSGAPTLLHPADRLAWWDGVSHVVTRPICLDHLNAVGPLKFRWTTWFMEYGGPTELKWSKQKSAAMNPPPAPFPRPRTTARRITFPGRIPGLQARQRPPFVGGRCWRGGGGLPSSSPPKCALCFRMGSSNRHSRVQNAHLGEEAAGPAPRVG